MSEHIPPSNTPQNAPPPQSAGERPARTWPKWLLAGGAILAIGVGVSLADWSRDGMHGGWRGHRGNGGMGGQGMSGQMGPGGMRGEQLCARDPLRFEGVARAYLKADLDLKPEQNVELDKLAQTLVPALKALRDEVCSSFAQPGGASAPERLEKLALVLRKAADTAEKTLPPAKAFYSALDDKQKARVDELADHRRRRH